MNIQAKFFGKNQTEMGKLCNVKQNTYNAYLSGSRVLTGERAELIRDALTPLILFIDGANIKSAEYVASILLLLNHYDVITPLEDFYNAMRDSKRIIVITDDKTPFLKLIAKAFEDSGLPEIPTRGIFVGENIDFLPSLKEGVLRES